jgi:hypothetical protein
MPKHGIKRVLAQLPPADSTAQAPQAPAQAPRISKQVRRAIELLLSGACSTQTAAAERVGISREHLSRQLSRDHVQVFIAREVRRRIGSASMPAAARMVALLHATSEHVSLDAARTILALNGIQAPQTGHSINIRNDVQVGYTIVLGARRAQREGSGDADVIGDQAGSAAKPLIEHDPVEKP